MAGRSGASSCGVGGDPEAFAELMWRYDPLVRSRLKGCASDEQLEVEIADFWCAMIADDCDRCARGTRAAAEPRPVADGARCVCV